jgi:ribose/xylose/arabinose/galactoside ABC-type transport system permease subunit
MKRGPLRALLDSPSFPGYRLLAIAVALNVLVQGPGFFSIWNFSTLATTAAPLVLVSVGQMIVILAGGIDLSVGATMALVNAVAIVAANKAGLPIWQSWTLALAVGTLIGAANGVVVAFFRLPPFLATFATSSMVQGLALVVLPSPGGTVPKGLYSVYGGFVLGLPTPVWIIALALLLWAYLSRTPLGKAIRASGGHPRNAFISTVRTSSVRLYAFTLCGFFAALAGLALTALTASGDPWIGSPFALKSMAAVILGGCLFDSGWGDSGAALSGALFFVIVSNVVFFAFSRLQALIPGFNVSTFYQDLATNLIIVFGLASAALIGRKPGWLGAKEDSHD